MSEETQSVGAVSHRSDVSFGRSKSDEGGVSDASDEEVVVETPVEVLPEGPEPSMAARRAGFVSLDAVNVEEMFRRRGCVMKIVPYFLRGPFRTVLRIALRQILSIDMVEREWGWKLFLLAPRMLLHRPRRGGLTSKETLASRCSKFARGEWMDLVNMGARCSEEASVAFRKKRRRGRDPDESRAARALQLVQLGELSSARQALEGAELAPGNEWTLREVRNPARRPDILRDPTPEDIMNMAPHEFELDEMFFLRTLRSSRKGAAGGPSGMTNEHLRPLLDSVNDSHLLFLAGEQLARANVPPAVVSMIRQGRMTALRKNTGVVRGIVAGDVVRRLVARTMARQMSEAVQVATSPFQFACRLGGLRVRRAYSACVGRQIQKPQSCPLMGSAHLISYLAVQCCVVSPVSQVGQRPSLSSGCFTGSRHSTSGRMMKAQSMKFIKQREESKKMR